MMGMLAWAAVLLFPTLCVGYNMWHAIDPMMVVCPVIVKPSPLPYGMTAEDWPTEQEFSVFINFDYDMDESKPHIISFMRTTQREVKITFEVTDAMAASVLPSTAITLEAEANLIATDSTCTCTGVNTGVDNATYGLTYGKSCSAWDQTNCATWYPETKGAWCCQQWCYVNKACKDAYHSEVGGGLYFSYTGACGGATVTSAATCSVSSASSGSLCSCINVDSASLWSTADVTKFGAAYGAECKTWDYDSCGFNYEASIIDTWCCESWCWVDQANCSDTALASAAWPGLYWSTAQCDDDVSLVNTCPWKAGVVAGGAAKAVASTGDCSCSGVSPEGLRSGRRRAGSATFPTDYGNACSDWDSETCAELFPLETTGIWCCQTWCYVDETCSTASASMVLPGYFWSYKACEEEREALSSCTYTTACQLTGSNSAMLAADITKFGTNYGKTCSAHDQASCETWWKDSDRWNAASTDWCCSQWAFVDSKCPLAEQSSLHADLWYSYGMCETVSPKYDLSAKTCSAARLLLEEPTEVFNSTVEWLHAQRELLKDLGKDDAHPGVAALTEQIRKQEEVRLANDFTQEEADRDEDAAQVRRLSGRRRGGGGYSPSRRRAASAPTRRRAASSSSTYSGPRRRAPAATRTSSPSRRRATTSDTTSAPRRRATAPTRRRAPATPAAPSRRRSGAPPAPATSSPRRRAPSAAAPAAPPATSPRRRSPRRRAADQTSAAAPGVDASLRRRTTSVTGSTGNSLDSSPRRRRAALATRRAGRNDERRRTSSYGYNSPSNVQNNYGGTMPAQTSYGYSGAGPQKSSKVPLMMAAGAGFVGGAALGVGAYYMYSRYNNGNSGTQNLQDKSWCRNPSGQTMTCMDCSNKYGASACGSENGCWGNSGCDYELTANTRRDDISTAGFIPMEYTAPLQIKITGILGIDFSVSAVCPQTQPDDKTSATWEKASTFSTDLFLTLTEQQNLGVQLQDAQRVDGIASDSLRLSPVMLPATVLLSLIMCSFSFRGARR